jgi:hypothetical protein
MNGGRRRGVEDESPREGGEEKKLGASWFVSSPSSFGLHYELVVFTTDARVKKPVLL